MATPPPDPSPLPPPPRRRRLALTASALVVASLPLVTTGGGYAAAELPRVLGPWRATAAAASDGGGRLDSERRRADNGFTSYQKHRRREQEDARRGSLDLERRRADYGFTSHQRHRRREQEDADGEGDGGGNKQGQQQADGGDGDGNGNNGDDGNGNADAQRNDDGGQDQQEQQNDNKEENQHQHDDYFDDKVADDQITDDDTTAIWDDFYAYEDDWEAPTVLPMTTRKYVGYSIIAVASTLGASGGVAGGGIVGAIYVLVVGLPLKVAIPVGAATVLGGAVGSTLVNLKRRHPLADRPLIDFDLVMVMEPLTLVGTLLGTLLHRVLSEKFLVIMLVMLLSVTAHTTLLKAVRMYRAEKRYARHLMAAQAPPPLGTPPGGSGTYAAWNDTQSAFQYGTRKSNGTPQNPQLQAEERERILILNPDYVTLRSDLAQQDKFTPRTKILALVGMMFVLTFLNINPWGIRCGSWLFYSNYLFMIVYLISCAWAAQTYLVARAEVKELVRFDYVHGDIKWNAKTALLYPAIFVMAGIFAGTLGIGGGVIIVPLLMHFGLHPSVATASSSAMILLTSFSATTSYLIYNNLLLDFGAVGFVLGFFSAIIGQGIMRRIRQATSASGHNFERNSYIAFVIGGVVLISALLMTIQYVLLIVVEEPDDWGKGVCDGISY